MTKPKAETQAAREEASAQEWLVQGQQIAMNTKASTWTVGDWWAKGEPYSHRPEAVELFAGIYTRRTLQQLGYVAKNVHPSVRTDELSLMHHQLVAPLDPKDQKRFLDKAVDEGLTVAVLRASIKGELRGPEVEEGDEGLDLAVATDDEPVDEFNQHAYLGDIRRLLAPKKTFRLDEPGRAELATFLERVTGRLAK